jgi:hypothetical protein
MKGRETCQSPLCGNRFQPLPEGGWRRTPKKFCCDECRQHASIIRRAAKLLEGLTDEKVIEILRRQ